MKTDTWIVATGLLLAVWVVACGGGAEDIDVDVDDADTGGDGIVLQCGEFGTAEQCAKTSCQFFKLVFQYCTDGCSPSEPRPSPDNQDIGLCYNGEGYVGDGSTEFYRSCSGGGIESVNFFGPAVIEGWTPGGGGKSSCVDTGVQ